MDGLDDAGRRRLRRAWWCALPTLAAYLGADDRPCRPAAGPLLRRLLRRPGPLAHARAARRPGRGTGLRGLPHRRQDLHLLRALPALLRMPVLAVTDRFDGRLTTLSMLLAAVVLAVASFRLLCSLRGLVRGTSPVGRHEPLATGLASVVVLVAPPFFLASQAVVHHEATLWGIALTVAAFDAVVRWQRRPTVRGLVVPSLLVLAAVLTRQSLGQGPLVALGLSGLVVAFTRARRARPDARGGRRGRGRCATRSCGPAASRLVPFAVAVAVNHAKFGTLLSPPSDKHNFSQYSAHRVGVLEANDGSLFGWQFVPSTLKQYFRPDGIDVRLDMPWIDFPRLGPSAVGETVFDKLDWTSSLPASAPALTVLTLVALWWALRGASGAAGHGCRRCWPARWSAGSASSPSATSPTATSPTSSRSCSSRARRLPPAGAGLAPRVGAPAAGRGRVPGRPGRARRAGQPGPGARVPARAGATCPSRCGPSGRACGPRCPAATSRWRCRPSPPGCPRAFRQPARRRRRV